MTERRAVAVAWARGPLAGHVEIAHGKLCSIGFARGAGRVHGNAFAIESPDPCRLELVCTDASPATAAGPARVSFRLARDAFTFFLHDVTREHPLFAPTLNVAVTDGDDARDYAQIKRDVEATVLDVPEESAGH